MASKIIVTDHPGDWTTSESEAEIVSPQDYFAEEKYQRNKKFKVINLCKSYHYQSLGYYVSLLAEARGHKVMPEISTLQEFRFPSFVREDAEDFDELIQNELKKVEGDKIEIHICFGQSEFPEFNRIGLLIFNLFQVPILRAIFSRKEKWYLSNLKPLNLKELPSDQLDLLKHSLDEYLEGKKRLQKQYSRKKFDLAILINPDEITPPFE